MGDRPNDGDGRGDEGHPIRDERGVVRRSKGACGSNAGVIDRVSRNINSKSSNGEHEEDKTVKEDAVAVRNRGEEGSGCRHLLR